MDEVAYGDTETLQQAHRNYGYPITTGSSTMEYAAGNISSYHHAREIQVGDLVLCTETGQADLTSLYSTHSGEVQ